MSDMLTRYNESESTTVQDARKQAEGDKATAANFFDRESTYQDNFTPRDKGNTTVTLSNADDDTVGNFTEDALSHYNQEIVDLANSHHKYNRSNVDSHYVNQNLNTPGAIYQHGASEK